jgi:hypothetical protein
MINFVEALQSLHPGAKWRILGEETYENITWLDEDIEKPTEQAILDEQARLSNLDDWNTLRFERTKLLTETDYLALADATLTDEMRAYRQALRDLPANTEDPANPVWPTKPS